MVGGGAITSKDKSSTKAYKGRHIGHEAGQPLSMEGAKRPRLRPCIVNAIDTLPPTSAHKFIHISYQFKFTAFAPPKEYFLKSRQSNRGKQGPTKANRTKCFVPFRGIL